MLDGTALLINIINDTLYERMLLTTLLVESDDSLFRTIELQSFALSSGADLRDIVKSEHHIL